MPLTIESCYAKSLQSCPTLCDPTDGSPTGSPVPGIPQARVLEWVAISFSNAWKWKVKVKSLSRVRPSATSWTAAHQAPPSMGFSRKEYWSRVPLPSPTIESSHPYFRSFPYPHIHLVFRVLFLFFMLAIVHLSLPCYHVVLGLTTLWLFSCGQSCVQLFCDLMDYSLPGSSILYPTQLSVS